VIADNMGMTLKQLLRHIVAMTSQSGGRSESAR
jgi:hypothetical protein